MAHIDTLVLNLGCYCHEARDYRDAVIPCSLATKSFFALFAVIPLALTKLELRDADLRETTPAILSALNLAILKDLGLQRCQGADIFLTSLSRSKHPPRLHSLRVNHVMPTGEDTIIAAIDDFLVCTPSCLRTLSIILRGYLILPKASSIIHHGFTLEHLFLDVRAYTNRTYDDCDKAARYRGPEFSTFISNLPHLTQLAMAFPKVIADASYAYAIEQNDEFNTQLVSKTFLNRYAQHLMTKYRTACLSCLHSSLSTSQLTPSPSALPAAMTTLASTSVFKDLYILQLTTHSSPTLPTRFLDAVETIITTITTESLHYVQWRSALPKRGISARRSYESKSSGRRISRGQMCGSGERRSGRI